MIVVACPEVNRNIFEWHLASEWGSGLVGRLTQLTYPEIFARDTLPRGAWILTGLDRLTPAGRQAARLVADHLVAAGVPVLNHPARILLRYDLLDALHRSGINRFRAVRASGDQGGLRFPVFIREENQHTGTLTSLLHDERELVRGLTHVRLKGYTLEELLIVEFCDTSSDGVFRKYSAYNIDGTILARNAQTSLDWMIKSEAQRREERFARDEFQYITENPHRESLAPVFALAGITYGRADFSVLDGRLQIWEINTAPSLGLAPDARAATPERARFRELTRPNRRLFFDGFDKELGGVERRCPEGPPVPCPLPPSLLAEWREEVRRHERLLRRRSRIGRVTDHPVLGELTRSVVPFVRGALGRLGW